MWVILDDMNQNWIPLTILSVELPQFLIYLNSSLCFWRLNMRTGKQTWPSLSSTSCITIKGIFTLCLFMNHIFCICWLTWSHGIYHNKDAGEWQFIGHCDTKYTVHLIALVVTMSFYYFYATCYHVFVLLRLYFTLLTCGWLGNSVYWPTSSLFSLK